MQNPPKMETVAKPKKVLEHAAHDPCPANPRPSDGRVVR